MPFLIKQPQLLVGTVINFLLITGISLYNFKAIIPALILPSLATYIYGRIFGGATHFLLYLIPFIIISNSIYVISFMKIRIKNEILKVILSSFLKTVFVFLCTFALYKVVGIPRIFLTVMGINQLITAVSGGLIALLVLGKGVKSL